MKWQASEVRYLEENWGRTSVENIARKLRRHTVRSIETKAQRLQLGSSRNAQGLLTAREFTTAIGTDLKVMYRWISQGLPAKKVVTYSKQAFWQISIDDWWKWAEVHQDEFNACKMEHLALGAEPEWMAEKRIRDKDLPIRVWRIWTEEEDETLMRLLKTTDLSYPKIGERLGRGEQSVGHRVMRLRKEGKL